MVGQGDAPGAAGALQKIQAGLYQLQERVDAPLRLLLPACLTTNGVYTQYHGLMEGLLKSPPLLQEIRTRGPQASDDHTVIGHLLQARHPDGRPLSDEELLAEIGILFFAGVDTTGHTIANTLLLLAQHPAEEAKVVAELDALGLLATPARPQPRALEWDDLPKLVVLGRAIKESMRLLPVVTQGTVRQSRGPLDLRPWGHDLTLPPGTTLYVPFFAFFRHKALWERGGEYLPDRWCDPHADLAPAAAKDAPGRPSGYAAFQTHSDGSSQPRRFLPFSDGPRDCVGQSLARVSFTTALALFLARFRFRLADKMGGAEGVREREQIALTLQHKGGVWMHAIPRA